MTTRIQILKVTTHFYSAELDQATTSTSIIETINPEQTMIDLYTQNETEAISKLDEYVYNVVLLVNSQWVEFTFEVETSEVLETPSSVFEIYNVSNDELDGTEDFVESYDTLEEANEAKDYGQWVVECSDKEGYIKVWSS